jgi:VanZ family protein
MLLSGRLLYLARIAAWSCIVAIAVLALLPKDDLLRTDFGGHAEHVFAYSVTALMLAAAHRSWRVLAVFVGLTAYAACLEYLQRFSPGRNSSLIDFAFSAFGVGVGVMFFVLLGRLQAAMGRPGV